MQQVVWKELSKYVASYFEACAILGEVWNGIQLALDIFQLKNNCIYSLGTNCELAHLIILLRDDS